MRALAALALLLTAPAAFAQGRPSTLNMTCAQAATLVASRGAVVLSTGPGLYDRYVAHQSLCPTGDFGRPAFARTRDNPQCNIGLYCTSMPPFWTR